MINCSVLKPVVISNLGPTEWIEIGELALLASMTRVELATRFGCLYTLWRQDHSLLIVRPDGMTVKGKWNQKLEVLQFADTATEPDLFYVPQTWVLDVERAIKAGYRYFEFGRCQPTSEQRKDIPEKWWNIHANAANTLWSYALGHKDPPQ